MPEEKSLPNEGTLVVFHPHAPSDQPISGFVDSISEDKSTVNIRSSEKVTPVVLEKGELNSTFRSPEATQTPPKRSLDNGTSQDKNNSLDR